MFEAVWQGLLTGLFLSTFTGPIFFMLLNLGINSTVRAVAYLALGTFVSDMLTVFLLYLAAGKFAEGAVNLHYLYIAGGLVLIAIGLNTLFGKLPKHTNEGQGHTGYRKVFMKGFMINSTNPNVFFFWFGAVMLAVKTYHNNTAQVLTHFGVALSIVFSTDFLKGYAASLLKPYITENLMFILSRFSGLVIIFFGVKLMLFH